jgi:hypothetical protein
VNRKVSREEMVVRLSQIYAGKARIKKCLMKDQMVTREGGVNRSR